MQQYQRDGLLTCGTGVVLVILLLNYLQGLFMQFLIGMWTWAFILLMLTTIRGMIKFYVKEATGGE